MNRLGLFLALFFGSLLCASAVFARGSLATWPHRGNPIIAAQADACTLDVVLVTFRDADDSSTDPAHQDSYNYEVSTGLGVKSAKGQTGGSLTLRIAGAIFCGCWRVATMWAGILRPWSAIPSR